MSEPTLGDATATTCHNCGVVHTSELESCFDALKRRVVNLEHQLESEECRNMALWIGCKNQKNTIAKLRGEDDT